MQLEQSCRFGLVILLLAGGVIRAEEPVPTMSVTNCVAYALAHSRDLKERELALDRQVLGTYITRGTYRSSLSAGGDWSDADDSGSGSLELKRKIPWGMDASAAYHETFEDDGDDTATLTLSLSKTLLGGGSRAESMLDIDNSLIDELVKGNAVHEKRRELVYRVRSACYNMIRSRQTLKVREMRLERAQRNLAVARERENPLDIANAELDVPDAESNVLGARREIDSALDRLKLVMGMAVAAPLDVVGDVDFAPAPVDAASDIAFSFGHSEEILNAELERQKLVNSLGVERERRWPKVSVGAGWRERAEDGESIGSGDQALTANASLAWELGSRTDRAKVEQSLIDLASRDVRTESLRESKASTIRDLARRLEESLSTIRHKQQGLAVSEKRVELYQDRWENGEIDILEYQRSQGDLENARIDLINQMTTYMERLAEYAYEVGR